LIILIRNKYRWESTWLEITAARKTVSDQRIGGRCSLNRVSVELGKPVFGAKTVVGLRVVDIVAFSEMRLLQQMCKFNHTIRGEGFHLQYGMGGRFRGRDRAVFSRDHRMEGFTWLSASDLFQPNLGTFDVLGHFRIRANGCT
jgi:hypothetical protein